MIKSMTGYGKSDIQTNDKVISIEIKSLNSKYLDDAFVFSFSARVCLISNINDFDLYL